MVQRCKSKKTCHLRSHVARKSTQFAKDLGNTEFRASNGWLETFCMRNNIAFYVKSSEKADVDIAVVEYWKKRL